MARENQGLQIALIVFVMLTILLGVTTYLGFRQYNDAAINVARLNTDVSKLNSDKGSLEANIQSLKGCLGAAPTESVDDLTNKLFKEDMNKYGAGYPEDSLHYRPLLEKMKKTIDERNGELTDVKAENQDTAGPVQGPRGSQGAAN